MRGIFLAAITALLWGVSPIALKVALNYFDSYTIVWFSFFVAAVVLVFYYSFSKPSLLSIYRYPPRRMIYAAILLAGHHIAYMQGVHYAGPGVTQIIAKTGPVILGIIGFTYFSEKLTRLRAIGFAISAIGFLLFYFNEINEFITHKDALNRGVLWTLGGAFSWAGYALFNKKLVQKHHPQQINLILFALSVLLFIPMVDFELFTKDYKWWVWVLMIALSLNMLLSLGCLSAAFKYTEANKISIVVTLNPVITFIILELLMFLNCKWFTINKVSLLAYIGVLLVMVGAILAIGMRQKSKSKKSKILAIK